jgi:hypothetical protein
VTPPVGTHGGDINDLGVMVGYATYLGPPFHLRPVVWR